jgi:aminoglycoside phosphotransferase family enzyme/predicted kinase
MEQMNQHKAICRAMKNPDFYPHPVSDLAFRETHASSVFLTGQWVYKLKKPVELGFLDFQTLENRHRFCELEVTLNQRLSQGIYLGVVGIYLNENGRFSLREDGRLVEYAVRMVQLPDEASLESLLRANKITAEQIQTLSQTLAAFYEKSKKSREIDYFGTLEVISANVEENFRQLAPYVDEVLDREQWDFIREINRSFLKLHESLFERRVKTKRISDGHGDLRSEHVYFYQGLQIIDCIEFNDRFRYGDTALDLAFLYMDMEHLGFGEWGRVLLTEFVNLTEDWELYQLVDFYAAYRSVVRLKVSCFRFSETTEDEKRAQREEVRLFLNQAYNYCLRFGRPTLWVFCGTPATGKSHLSKEIANAMSVPVFQSDLVRKEEAVFKKERVSSSGKRLYRLERRQLVYGFLLARAQDTIKSGRSVILDATFGLERWRDDVRELAEDMGCNIIFIECVCREETAKKRLKERENEQDALSDARLDNYRDILKNFQPMSELPLEIHIVADTDRPLKETMTKVLSEAYTLRGLQVEAML